MENYQELYHWGIKGQKWGIRRYQNEDGTLTEAGKKRYYYQNPDGSLTEEGKKHYMEAARKGKLNPKKLSDADLNMINTRFAKEKTYNENVKKYQESKFSYKLKEALVTRIKNGGGGGGGGGGSKKGGKSALGQFLAMPIQKAFENAFKFNAGKGNDNEGNDNSEDDRQAKKQYKKYLQNGHSWTESFKWSKVDKKNQKRWANEGKRFLDTSSKDWSWEKNDKGGYTQSGDNRSSGNRTAEQILKDRYKPKPPKKVVSYAAKKEKKWDNLATRAAKSGIIISHSDTNFVVTRASSDELMHHGIKGQKWGIRRYQNEDGTLTEAGKARIARTAGYGYLNPEVKDIKNGKAKQRHEISNRYDDEYWKNTKEGMPGPDREIDRKLWNKFKTDYASATLRDLKMHDTPKARSDVKKILAKIDPDYLYRTNDSTTIEEYEKYWEKEDRRAEQFKKRRESIEHPIRTKVKKTANKALDVASKIAPIVKVMK